MYYLSFFFSFSLLTLFYVCDSFEDEAETKNRAEIVLFQREEIRFIIIRCGWNVNWKFGFYKRRYYSDLI